LAGGVWLWNETRKIFSFKISDEIDLVKFVGDADFGV